MSDLLAFLKRCRHGLRDVGSFRDMEELERWGLVYTVQQGECYLTHEGRQYLQASERADAETVAVPREQLEWLLMDAVHGQGTTCTGCPMLRGCSPIPHMTTLKAHCLARLRAHSLPEEARDD